MKQKTFEELEIDPSCTGLDLITSWLNCFNKALDVCDETQLSNCFCDNAHWRDLVAFTWNISPSQGNCEIARKMVRLQRTIKAHSFCLAENRTAPRRINRLGIPVIEAIFYFETELGRGEGVIRLIADEPSKAWTFLTTLYELKSYEEKI